MYRTGNVSSSFLLHYTYTTASDAEVQTIAEMNRRDEKNGSCQFENQVALSHNDSVLESVSNVFFSPQVFTRDQ